MLFILRLKDNDDNESMRFITWYINHHANFFFLHSFKKILKLIVF